MPYELTEKQILTIWSDKSVQRAEMANRQEYFDGDQDILDEKADRYDGSKRNLNVTNWIKYIVNKHVGFMTAKPVHYVLKDPKASKDGIEEFDRIDILNTLDANDQEHLRQSVMKGYSVEVQSYDGANIQITQYDPQEWAILYDELDKPQIGIHCSTRPANTIFNGQFLEKEKTIYTVYDDKSIKTYELFPKDEDAPDEEEDSLNLLSVVEHQYQRLPLTIFRVNKKRASFIGDDIISQQDSWNTVRSSNLDDLQYNVDAILKISGYDPDAMFETDVDGITFIEKLRKHRILPLKDGGDATFIEKGNEKEKVSYDLELTRDALHMMARVADVEKIVGSTGTTSGIVLKLCLMPQIDQAIQFSVFFEEGLRDRIDLINRMNAILDRPMLENFNVVFTLNIPVNETEIWQYIGNLDHLMTRKTQLSLIPSIEDPEAEANAKELEMKEDALALMDQHAEELQLQAEYSQPTTPSDNTEGAQDVTDSSASE